MPVISFDLTDGNLFDNTVINGTVFDDDIYGDLGNDTLRGYDGDDTLFGNGGNDYLWGGADNDQLRGGAGNDIIHGGSGIDEVYEFGNFNYTLTNSQLIGNGVDTLISVEKARIFGGAGTNYINASAFTGSTSLHGLDGDDIINGGSGEDSIWGGTGNDGLYGNEGDDQLLGEDGDDVLNGGTGEDTLNGGAGIDTVYMLGDYNYSLTNTSLLSYIGYDSLGGETDSLQSIEKVTLIGGQKINVISAKNFTGQTQIFGLDNDDLLTGGLNADYIDGGNGYDSINGGAGNDTLLGREGRDQIRAGAGNDSIDGGAGSDSYLQSGDFNYYVTDTQVTGNGIDSLKSIEEIRIDGGQSNNTINAYNFSGNSVLDGKEGNDLIFSGNIEDTLRGGEGNDTLYGFGGDDRFTGGAGDDTIYGGTGFDVIDETVNSSFVLNNTWLLGNGFDRFYDIEKVRLIVENGDHFIDASDFGGSTTLGGRSGTFLIKGGYGHDLAYGDEGHDTLYGNNGNDTLVGGGGNDSLLGGAGNDEISGTYGPGALAHGYGERDVLTSGSLFDSDLFILGAYHYVYYYEPYESESGVEGFARISDFDLYGVGTQDKIQLEGNKLAYSLSHTTIDGQTGVGIYYKSELIGLVQGTGVNTSSLNLNNSNQFIYV